MGRVKVTKVCDKTSSSSKTLEPLKIHFEHADFTGEKAGRDLSKYFTGHLFSNFSKLSGGTAERITKDCKQVVALENESMVYIGSTQGHETLTSGSMKTYIGIKRKKELCLYEATPVTVSPFVREHSYVKENDKDTSMQQTPKERRLADVELAKAFGSKKKRLYLEKQEKNRVTDMNDSIMSAAAEAKTMDMPHEMKDESILNVIPPCNREAALVTEVYRIGDILTDEDMNELESYAIACLEASEEDIAYWKENETFSDYFFAVMTSLRFLKTEVQNIRSMKLTLYAEILIRLYKIPPPRIKKAIPQFPEEFPHRLVEKAFDNFTTVNALNIRVRSDEMKNKLCCYIMVLVLLANDFNFDVQLMSTIFQIHIKKLLTLTKAVGMTVKYNSVSKSYSALLKLPLPKQIERRGAHQRRVRK